MNGIEYFKAKYGLFDHDFVLVPYGSRVYGTNNDKSDYDFMAIVPENRKADTGTEFLHDNVNIHIYNKQHWQQQLDAHKIHALEGWFHPDCDVKKRFKFKLNLGMLRNELSAKASHSFVKAKKKIEVEQDYYIGWKSLFHSIRILNFGKQIADSGGIEDFGAVNSVWFDLLNEKHYTWETIKQKYQPMYNKFATEFKKVAPK